MAALIKEANILSLFFKNVSDSLSLSILVHGTEKVLVSFMKTQINLTPWAASDLQGLQIGIESAQFQE